MEINVYVKVQTKKCSGQCLCNRGTMKNGYQCLCNEGLFKKYGYQYIRNGWNLRKVEINV